MSWLLRGDDVLAALGTRRRGEPISGAVVIRRPVIVHTMTEAVALDVAWCGDAVREDGTPCLEVRCITVVRPRRVTRRRIGGTTAVVACEGAFDRWRLRVGDHLEIRDA